MALGVAVRGSAVSFLLGRFSPKTPRAVGISEPQSREQRRLNRCITLRALAMDMSGHNGTSRCRSSYRAGPRVFVAPPSPWKRERETLPPLSRPR